MLRITELPLRVWSNNFILDISTKEKKRIEKFKLKPLIKDIDKTHTNDRTIDIRIKLHNNAVEYLESIGDNTMDGVEKYFELYRYMDTHLNMMTENLAVCEFSSYKEILWLWFNIRREHYLKRIMRHETLLKYKIIRIQNIIRYIEMKLEVSELTNEQQDELLRVNSFVKINSTLLNAPKFTKNEDLERLILDGSYDYLLDISDRQKSKQNLSKRYDDLAKVEQDQVDYCELTNNTYFKGKEIWLNELRQLEHVILEGKRTCWLYDEFGKYKYD
jgi:hypothetical protein